MSVNSTLLSTILTRMNRNTQCSTVADNFKVLDLDEAIRTMRRTTRLPWMLQKGSLRIFEDILEYPVPVDYDGIAYLDNSKSPRNTSGTFFPAAAYYRYTNLQQFYQDPDNRNEMADIWDNNTRFIGVNYKNFAGMSVMLDNMETPSLWTASNDASNPVLDIVNYYEGNGSIRFTNSASTGTATMVGNLLTSYNDANYQRKYYFVYIYLSGLPTSIDLQLRIDGSNYLYKNGITTQFSGQPLKINDWNTLAFDLNVASVQGTIGTSPTFTQQAVVLHGAPAGAYNLDASFSREWILQDFWYYSLNSVMPAGAANATQEWFMNPTTQAYDPASAIVGDSEWIDCIMYDAMLTEMDDTKDPESYKTYLAKRADAWNSLVAKYPSLEPLQTTNKYLFIDDYSVPMGPNYEIVNP